MHLDEKYSLVVLSVWTCLLESDRGSPFRVSGKSFKNLLRISNHICLEALGPGLNLCSPKARATASMTLCGLPRNLTRSAKHLLHKYLCQFGRVIQYSVVFLCYFLDLDPPLRKSVNGVFGLNSTISCFSMERLHLSFWLVLIARNSVFRDQNWILANFPLIKTFNQNLGFLSISAAPVVSIRSYCVLT